MHIISRKQKQPNHLTNRVFVCVLTKTLNLNTMKIQFMVNFTKTEVMCSRSIILCRNNKLGMNRLVSNFQKHRILNNTKYEAEGKRNHHGWTLKILAELDDGPAWSPTVRLHAGPNIETSSLTRRSLKTMLISEGLRVSLN